jgi:hypothetical protein
MHGSKVNQDSVKRLFTSGFYRESFSHRPLKKPIVPFLDIFKIHEDICNSRLTICVNNTSGKLIAGINIIDTSDYLTQKH